LVLHPKPTNKLVKTHSAHFWCWNKPWATLDSLDSPQLEFRGSHHLPPYSILCVSLPHLHLNGTFSQDSQSGVPKLSRFRLSGLWAFITSHSDLRLGRGLKKTCSSPSELSNNVLHLTCTHWDWVDSWLLVVGSQIASLTSGLSFSHNLCCRCSNGSCKVISDIYTSRSFQRYKEHLNARCFDPCNYILSFWESRRTPKPHFRECEWRPHTSLQNGVATGTPLSTYFGWKDKEWTKVRSKWKCKVSIYIVAYCAKWLLIKHLKEVHGLVTKKAKPGRPSTSKRGPWHQDHAKMNACIIGNAMAVQRQNY